MDELEAEPGDILGCDALDTTDTMRWVHHPITCVQHLASDFCSPLAWR